MDIKETIDDIKAFVEDKIGDMDLMDKLEGLKDKLGDIDLKDKLEDLKEKVNDADLKEKLEDSYRENYRLLTTDRMLQTFMVCVFALLIAVILWCRFSSGFGDAEEY